MIFILYSFNKLKEKWIVVLCMASVVLVLHGFILHGDALVFFDGVLASIMATITFETYRGYCNYRTKLKMANCYYTDFKSNLEFFCSFIFSNRNLIHMYGDCKTALPKFNDDLHKVLLDIGTLLEVFEQKYCNGDNLLGEKKPYQASDEYMEGIEFYKAFASSYNKYLLPIIESCVHVIPFYFDDEKISEKLYKTSQLSYTFNSLNEVWPDAFFVRTASYDYANS